MCSLVYKQQEVAEHAAGAGQTPGLDFVWSRLSAPAADQANNFTVNSTKHTSQPRKAATGEKPIIVKGSNNHVINTFTLS